MALQCTVWLAAFGTDKNLFCQSDWNQMGKNLWQLDALPWRWFGVNRQGWRTLLAPQDTLGGLAFQVGSSPSNSNPSIILECFAVLPPFVMVFSLNQNSCPLPIRSCSSRRMILRQSKKNADLAILIFEFQNCAWSCLYFSPSIFCSTFSGWSCATLIFICRPSRGCCVIYVRSVQVIYVAGVWILEAAFYQVTFFWLWWSRIPNSLWIKAKSVKINSKSLEDA